MLPERVFARHCIWTQVEHNVRAPRVMQVLFVDTSAATDDDCNDPARIVATTTGAFTVAPDGSETSMDMTFQVGQNCTLVCQEGTCTHVQRILV